MPKILKDPLIHAAIVIFVGLGIVGQMDLESAQLDDVNYCKMVNIYKSTNGGYGWPDYNGTYNSLCLDSDSR